jgi:hypothetical protein
VCGRARVYSFIIVRVCASGLFWRGRRGPPQLYMLEGSHRAVAWDRTSWMESKPSGVDVEWNLDDDDHLALRHSDAGGGG